MPRTLAQNAQYIAETIKPAIKSAIEAQGVTVPSTDSFLDYADRIAEIEGGGSGYQLKDLPTGAISTVNDAAELPLNALKVSVEAWQEGSGDPSPSNIRPIHGRSSGIVNVESKNAVNLVFANDTNSIVGLDFSHTVSSFTLSGTATGGYKIFQLTNLPKIKIGTTYTYSVRVSGTKARCFVGFRFYKNGTEISGGIARANLNDDDLSSISFSLNSDFDAATYVIEGIQANTVFDCTVEVQLEAGKRVTAFTPYVNGNQYTQQFPQAIYGAEWDVVNGGIKNKTFVVDDWQNLVSRGQSSSGSYRYGLAVSNMSAYDVSEIISRSNALKYRVSFNGDDYEFYNSNELIIFLPYDNLSDAIDFLTTNNVEIEVPYQVSQTIPISPLSIRMLQGTNNIYADCGEVLEGEYFIGSSGAYDLYDYIQSDGTQCIDLGVKINANEVVKCIYIPLSGMTNWDWLWIAEDTNTSKFSGVVFMSSSQMADYDYSVESNRRSWTANQISESSLTASAAINANVKFSDGAIVKLYSLSINNNYFLPCKRKSDGVFGLYDVANSQFLTDSASGNAFVGGNNLGVRIG